MKIKSCDITLIMGPMWSTTVPWTAPALLYQTLVEKGYKVQFIDYNIRLYHLFKELGFERLWSDSSFFVPWVSGQLNYLADLIDLDEIQGGVIGFCTTQTNLNCSLALAERIRERYPRRKIIFGGHAVHFPNEIKDISPSSTDAICKGEGEEVICEVMEQGFDKLDRVAGLYLPCDHGWQLNRERPPIRNLDSVPWPRYSEIDFGQYDKPYLGLFGSRGCVGRCIFCTERSRLPGFRTRSAKHQADELEYLSKQFPVEHFPYYDALANGNYRVMAEKADEIIRRRLKVDYSGNLMVRDNMPDDLFPLIRKSGFSVAFIGIESGSAATLSAMRKNHNPEGAASFLRKCHNAGIRTEVNFIIGFPTETEAHFQETLDFVRDNRANIDAIISVNTFGMGPSDLWNDRDTYRVIIDDVNAASHQWHTADHPNTLEVRQERLNRFLALEEELGLRGEVLISDNYSFNTPCLPEPEALLALYVSHCRAAGPSEYAKALAAAQRVRLALRLRKPTPLEIAGKLTKSLRSRGMRQTIRRTREWLQIRLKKH